MASGEDNVDAAQVDQFVAVTEASADTARTYVSAADGDLQTAIAMYFAAGHGDAAPPANRDVPRRQPELRDTAVPPSAPVDPVPPSPPRRRSGNPLGIAIRAIGVVFSTAFQAADWVIGLLLPGSAYRAWRGILTRLLGASVGSHTPVSALLTEAYGDNILQFRDGRWQHAYNRACQQGKPLLVYLHSDNNPATAEFCSEALCDEDVIAFASANFVCWGAPSDSTDAVHLTRLLRVATFPFMAILAPAEPSTSASMHSPARIRVLAALNGAPDTPMGPQLLALLQSGTEQAQQFQTETARRQEAAATAAAEARSLREEQDAALAASMAEDRRRGEEAAAARRRAAEEQEAEEAEKRALQEEQERKLQMIEDRRNAIDERREQKRAALAPEPAAGDSSAPTTLIRVRLPHGGSSQRRFDESAGVAVVYDWVDSLAEIDVWDYVITSTFPRREFSRSEGDVALRDAGLVPNAAIMVIAQDN